MNKKILVTIMLSTSIAGTTSSVYATCPGLYFGVMGGLANTSVDSSNLRVFNDVRFLNNGRFINRFGNTSVVHVGGAKVDGIRILDETSGSRKFAGRIYGGYQTNDYLGFEMGFTGLSTFNLRVVDFDLDEGLVPPVQRVNAFLGWFDFSARLGLNYCKFGVFAKAGLAVTYLSFDVDQIQNFDDDNNFINGNHINNDIIVVTPNNGGDEGNCNGTNNCNGTGNNNSQNNSGNDINSNNVFLGDDNVESVTKTQTRIRPIVSLGASYDFTPNWVMDVSWNRLFVNGVVRHVDFWALGLSYHFVERYCGQFLCDD